MTYPLPGEQITYRGTDNKLYSGVVIKIIRAIPENKIQVQSGDRLNVIRLEQIVN